MRLSLFQNGPQRRTIQHVDHMRPVCHLHGRRVRIPVYRNDLAPQPLQFYNNFFAQLT